MTATESRVTTNTVGLREANLKASSAFFSRERIGEHGGFAEASRIHSAPGITADPVGAGAPSSIGGGPMESGGFTHCHPDLRK